MQTIEAIMTPKPFKVSQHVNINKARLLMADHKIRHLPVVDIDSGRVIGLLSQRALLGNALKIINKRGFEQLENCEKSTDVGSIMDIEPAVCQVSDKLMDVAHKLKALRSGCVSIELDNQLVGVVTSSDFVKLYIDQQD